MPVPHGSYFLTSNPSIINQSTPLRVIHSLGIENFSKFCFQFFSSFWEKLCEPTLTVIFSHQKEDLMEELSQLFKVLDEFKDYQKVLHEHFENIKMFSSSLRKIPCASRARARLQVEPAQLIQT
jgi:hypothetical protein